jgi:hypothetical protein
MKKAIRRPEIQVSDEMKYVVWSGIAINRKISLKLEYKTIQNIAHVHTYVM